MNIRDSSASRGVLIILPILLNLVGSSYSVFSINKLTAFRAVATSVVNVIINTTYLNPTSSTSRRRKHKLTTTLSNLLG